MSTHELIVSGPRSFLKSALRAFAERSQDDFSFPGIGEAAAVSSELEKAPPRRGRDLEMAVVVYEAESRDEAVRVVSEALEEIARRTGKEEQREEVTIQ